MKKILIYFWLMAFVLALLPVTARAQISHQSNFNNVSVQYQDTVVGSVTYRAYTVDGMEVTTTPECPQVPKQVLTFSVPYNAKNIAVQVTGGQSQTSGTLPFKLIPVLRERAICDSLPDVLTPDSTVYNTNAFYPANAAEMVGEGYYMGENHIVTVAAYPIQYNPVTNKIKLNKLVNYTITYNLDSNVPGNMLVRNDQTLRQQGWDEVKTIVMNPNQVESFAPTNNVIQQSYSLLHHNDSIQNVPMMFLPFDYAIITTNELMPSLKRLAALKRQKGYKVGIFDIEYILNSSIVQGGEWCMKKDGTYSSINDFAGKLRAYMKYLYNFSGTQYVLFCGRNIPFRYGYLNSNDTYATLNHQQKDNFPTDWYFSDLTSNWNQDGDSFYGERNIFSTTNGKLDFYPELYVGRLMCDNVNDMNNYTKKLMTYELNPGHGDTSYLQSALFVDGSDFGHAEDVAQSYGNTYSGQTVVRIVDDNYPKGSDIIEMINQNHYGLLSLHGHGAPNMVSVNNHSSPYHRLTALNSTTPNLANDGLDCLTNRYYPNINYSWSCEQTPFDYYTEPATGHTYTGINMGQSYTLGYDYGGVAFLGYTRYGYVSSYKYEKLFAKMLQNGITVAGKAEAWSKYESQSVFHTLGHNLIGDPEFDIWTSIPSSFSNVNVVRNDNSISVTGINSDDATVAICENSTEAMQQQPINGVATFSNVSPNSTVMVFQHNYLPYIAPLYIQNATLSHSQYVIASDAYLGRNVDSNRSEGNVVIPMGVDYEMEFTGEVILAPGVEIQKGASLTITASDY